MEWVKKADVEAGLAPAVTSEVAAKLKALGPENRELRQANEILRKASAYFAAAERGGRPKTCSHSSMIIVAPTGSSRSARSCRSPHPPTMSMQPGARIHPGCSNAPGVTVNLCRK